MGKVHLPALGAVLVLAACVSVALETRADRAYHAGDLEGAAQAYEEALESTAGGPREAHALYRLALIYSRPDSLLHDGARAAELLRRLLRDYPDSSYAPQASLILDLQRQAEQLRQMSSELANHIRRVQEEAELTMASLQEEIGRVQGEAEAKQQRIGQLERQLAGLREELGGFNEEVARLEEELRRLKEIDLARPP